MKTEQNKKNCKIPFELVNDLSQSDHLDKNLNLNV